VKADLTDLFVGLALACVLFVYVVASIHLGAPL
jgi:hypothetical protein